VVAMVTPIGHSFSFTLSATGRVTKGYHTSSTYRSNTGSFENKVSSPSALGMATWSNGELKEMIISFFLHRCVRMLTSLTYFHQYIFRAGYQRVPRLFINREIRTAKGG